MFSYPVYFQKKKQPFKKEVLELMKSLYGFSLRKSRDTWNKVIDADHWSSKCI